MQWVGGAHNLLATCEVSSSGQIFLFIMLLELLQRFFFLLRWRMTSMVEWFVANNVFFFIFPSFLLEFVLDIQNFKVSKLSFYLLRFKLCSLFFWFLIFVLDHFVKFKFIFSFIFQSEFVICYFIQFGPRYFDYFFWVLLLNCYFFSISPFN